ncbi:hypothetical protein Hanom_Chr00s020814g01759921 [Helianthus anomalus]
MTFVVGGREGEEKRKTFRNESINDTLESARWIQGMKSMNGMFESVKRIQGSEM